MSAQLKTLELLQDHGSRRKGDRIEVDALRAERMIADHIAREPQAKKEAGRKPTAAKESENNG